MREFIFREAETLIPVKGKRLVAIGELVRCKDCKKRKTDRCLMYWNEIKDDETWDDNWFCADGERKERGEADEVD